MSTDHSSLPSTREARSRWEQMSQSSDTDRNSQIDSKIRVKSSQSESSKSQSVPKSSFLEVPSRISLNTKKSTEGLTTSTEITGRGTLYSAKSSEHLHASNSIKSSNIKPNKPAITKKPAHLAGSKSKQQPQPHSRSVSVSDVAFSYETPKNKPSLNNSTHGTITVPIKPNFLRSKPSQTAIGQVETSEAELRNTAKVDKSIKSIPSISHLSISTTTPEIFDVDSSNLSQPHQGRQSSISVSSANLSPTSFLPSHIPQPPPSRPVTPVTVHIPNTSHPQAHFIPNPGQPPEIPFATKPTLFELSNHNSHSETVKPPLPDPSSFPPPPRHHTLINSRNEPHQNSSAKKCMTLPISGSSSDPSKLMPPPSRPITPVTLTQKPQSFHDSQPFHPPMPPPSRKLRSSDSQSSLKSDKSPLVSPAIDPQHGQDSCASSYFNTTAPHTPSFQASHSSNTPSRSVSASHVPFSETFLGNMPDPSSFPPPPQRGDISSANTQIRRTSDSVLPYKSQQLPTQNSHQPFHASPSQLPPLMPPPKRGGSASEYGNYSSGPDESNYESDDSTPTGTSTSQATAESVHYADSSQVNRKAPIYNGPIHELPAKGKIEAVAFFGTIACFSTSSSVYAIDIETNEKVWALTHLETKVTAIEFKPCSDAMLNGRIIWLGTKEGHLWEVDISHQGIAHKRTNVHMKSIITIQAVRNHVWTLSEDGKICIWDGYINDVPKVFRTTPFFKAFCIAQGDIWVGRNRQVYIYHPSVSGKDPFNITNRPINCPPMAPGKVNGEFTCAACIQRYPDLVFFGHEDGTISVFSRSKCSFVDSASASLFKITSMTGVGTNLWVGTSSGIIYVIDVESKPWKIIKEWKAHDSSVRAIVSNERSFFSSPQMSHMPVVSVGSELGIYIWDGLLKTDWIENDMTEHDAEYCSFNEVKLFYLTWNTGAARPGDLDFFDYDKKFLETAFKKACDYKNGPEIIVFGFQEVVELDNRSLAAKTMFQSSSKKKKEKDCNVQISSHISTQYKDWQDRLGRDITDFFNENYNLVHSSNMVGLFTCIFVKARDSPRIHSIKSGKTKTGLGGLHGNKGGIGVRFMMDDSSLCFVNCHLAAGQNHILQRNKDIETILETPLLDQSENTNYIGKGVFVNGGDGTMILDHEFCFFSGDMNYRINLHKPTALAMIKDKDFPRLLDADQLLMQLKRNPGHRLRSFVEPPIRFNPTYKFNPGTDEYDSSEKQRVPAWCDRIYYRGRGRIDPIYYDSISSVKISDHKPVSGLYTIKVKTIDPSLRKDAYKKSLNRWQSHLENFVEGLAQYYQNSS